MNSNAEQSLLTSDFKNKPMEEIQENLIKVIEWKIPETTEESEEKDFSTPVFLDDDLVQQEKKILELAKETQI